MKIDGEMAAPLPRQGDAYYWQHQSQLQQSALSFESSIHLSQVRVDQLNVRDNAEPHAIESDGFDTPTVMKGHLLMLIEPLIASPVELTPVLLEPLVRQIERLAGVLPSVAERVCVDEKTEAIHQSSAFKTPVLPSHRPYQLFIDKGQVELALNTAAFPKQSIDALHQVIKQWLLHKGYSLKQLIINGVPQR